MYRARVNNLSPLPFYRLYSLDEMQSWDCQKWYAYGRINPLLADKGLPPTFFTKLTDSSSAIGTIRLFQMKEKSGFEVSPMDFEEVPGDWKITMLKIGLKVDEWGYLKYSRQEASPVLEKGIYYLVIEDKDISAAPRDSVYLVSDLFQVIDRTEKNLEIEWSFDYRISNGLDEIPNDITFRVLLDSTIAKPEYMYEEEGEERLGFFYPTKQLSYKKYKFSFLAPEYLCDVVRMIPLCDHLTISSQEVMHPTKIDFDMEWLEQGTLANVECEFTTNTIIKRASSSYISENLGDFNDDFNDDFHK